MTGGFYNKLRETEDE